MAKRGQLQGVLSERLVDSALLEGQVVVASSLHLETDLEIGRNDVWLRIRSFQPCD